VTCLAFCPSGALRWHLGAIPMDASAILGLALTIIFGILPFTKIDIPGWITWPVFGFGVILFIMAVTPMKFLEKFQFGSLAPSTYFVLAPLFAVAAVFTAWHGYNIYRDGWPLKWIWGSFLLADRNSQSGQLRIGAFVGLVENISKDEVKINELSIISGMNGSRLPVKMNDRFGKYLDPQEFHPLPPGSQPDFQSLFKTAVEAMPEGEFLANWGSFEFVAKYAGREYRKQFSSEDIREQLNVYQPPLPTPYPSKRQP
jgi:hypothetical protein